MKNYQRLSEVSGLPVRTLLALFERIRSAKILPEEIRSSLNDQKEIWTYRQASWDLTRGHGLLAASISLVGLAPALTEAGKLLALACLLGGSAFLFRGYRRRSTFNRRLHEARTLRRRLEGTDGFLWRFQALLEYRDADGPIHIHAALVESCKASKAGTRRLSRLQLLQYWHWVSMVESHLAMADAGLHDERLDPF